MGETAANDTHVKLIVPVNVFHESGAPEQERSILDSPDGRSDVASQMSAQETAAGVELMLTALNRGGLPGRLGCGSNNRERGIRPLLTPRM